jgi:hypothetical protein
MAAAHPAGPPPHTITSKTPAMGTLLLIFSTQSPDFIKIPAFLICIQKKKYIWYHSVSSSLK